MVSIFKKINKEGVIFGGALVASLLWSTVVACLGLQDKRIWNSFFLQYFWEFILGMLLAKIYNRRSFDSTDIKFRLLLPVCFICILITGITGIKGGIWKVYNDIPSMLGYLSAALILYKLKIFNKFFIYTNKFSYEWYLVHIVVFVSTYHLLAHIVNHQIYLALIALMSSYVLAYFYHRLLISLHLK